MVAHPNHRPTPKIRTWAAGGSCGHRDGLSLVKTCGSCGVSVRPVRCRQSIGLRARPPDLAQKHSAQAPNGIVLRLMQCCHQLRNACVWLLLTLVEHALRLRSLLVGISHELPQQLLKSIAISQQELYSLLGHRCCGALGNGHHNCALIS